MVLFLMLGGVVADRQPRRRVMMAADVARAVVLVVLGTLSLSGALELWMLASLAALYGAGEAFFGPAFSALIPELVPSDLLLPANAVQHAVRPIAGKAIGPALGGGIVAWLGPGGGFLLDAGTFAFSFACLAALRVRETPTGAAPVGALREVREGFAYVRAHAWLWATLLSAAMCILVFWGPEEVLVPYLVKNEFGGTAAAFGLVMAVGGLGDAAGSFFMGRRKLPRRPVTFMYWFWGLGMLPLAAYAAATETWHLLPLAFAFGFAMSTGLVGWSTLMQTRVPRELRGRVTSLDWLVSLGLAPLSFALTAPVSDAIGIDATFIVAGGAAAVLTLGLLYLVPGLREPAHAGAPSPSFSGHDEVTGRVAGGADPGAAGDGGGDAGGVRELHGPAERRPRRG
jgi:DHA3 family tetracycline resistance protein-like MFS transporter